MKSIFRPLPAAFAVVCVALAAWPAQAQYTTVSAAYLGGTQTPVNGTIYWQPIVAARIGSASGQVLSGMPQQATVTAGAFSLSIADALVSDPNTCYAVTAVDGTTGAVLLGAGLDASGHVRQGGAYGCVQPTGSTWSFDTYVPPVAPAAAPSQPYVSSLNGITGGVTLDGCTQSGSTITCSGGGGGSITFPTGIQYGADSTSAPTAATSSEIQTAIGGSVYDASGAAATAQSNAETYAQSVSTTGTAAGLSGSQTANYVYAGPASGSASTATWRLLVAADIPSLSSLYCSLGGCTLTGGLVGTTANFSGAVQGASFNSVLIAAFATNDLNVGAALSSGATGVDDTATGYDSLGSNTNGSENAAYGADALATVTTGSYDTALGFVALFSSTGSYNTAVGSGALQLDVGGGGNTAVGFQALTDDTSGSGNVAVGDFAGGSKTGLVDGVFVGYNAAPSSNSDTNEIVIGYGATGNGSNTITLGNSSITAFYVPGIKASSTTSCMQIDSSGNITNTGSACGTGSGSGSVTSVGWTGGIVSVANPTTTPAFTVAGTSGGIPYFSSSSAWASSAALASGAIVTGGGAGTAPSTDANATLSTGTLSLGASGTLGAVKMGNATSGTITLEPATGALGTITEYLPISSGDTLAGIAATQTLTNKTLTSPALGGTVTGSGTIPLGVLGVAGAVNTVVGAATSTTHADLTMPSCSGSTNALIWTTGTGFGCNTISGGGGISGSGTADYYALFTGTSTLGNGHLDDGLTATGTITSSEPIAVSGTTHGIVLPAGTAASGVSGSVVYATDSTNGYAEVDENNTGLSRVCTAANGVCVIKGTVTIGGSSVSAHSCTSGTATVTGAAVGNVPHVSVAASPGGYFAFYPLTVATANSVTVEVCNIYTSSETPTSETYSVSIP